MVFPTEVFLSELVGRPVVGASGEKIGRVRDVGITLGEIFPKASSLEIEMRGGKREILTWKEVGGYLGRVIVLKGGLEDILEGIKPAPEGAAATENEVMLRRDILDKQIVDIYGRKVVRVNDLKLALANGDIRLIAVDVGMRGLLRRFGGNRILKTLGRLLGREVKETLIGWNYVEPLETELSAVKLTVPHEKLFKLHPADIAEIIEDLHSRERTAIFSALDAERAAETLGEVEPEVQTVILKDLATEKASDILEQMDPDDAADILSEMHEEKAEELLSHMEQEEAAEVRELLEYDKTTAGGLMTTEYIAFPATLTAEQTINELRRLAPETETIYYVYVVDEAEHLTGVISLRNLIVAAPETALSDIMITDVIFVQDDAPQEEVAEFISKYDLLALPVVDKDKSLLGIVTVDDVLDVVMAPPRRRRLRRRT